MNVEINQISNLRDEHYLAIWVNGGTPIRIKLKTNISEKQITLLENTIKTEVEKVITDILSKFNILKGGKND